MYVYVYIYKTWNSNTLATSCEELTHWKRPWCWEGLGTGGEGDDRGWDGWMASPTWWTWVWVNSWSWWWAGKPGVLRFMGSQRVRHDWVTELNWATNTHTDCITNIIFFMKYKIKKITVKNYSNYISIFISFMGFPCGSAGKEFACNVGDPGSIPGSGRSPGEGNATHSSILAWRIPWTV